MPWLAWSAEALAAVVGLALLYVAVLVARRRWLSRAGGTFELSLRLWPAGGSGPKPSVRGWLLGVGRYTGDSLEFFRSFSVFPRPTRVLVRRDLSYLGPREMSPLEAHALFGGHVVVACGSPAGTYELSLSPDALTGFLAWLEAAPPGHDLVH